MTVGKIYCAKLIYENYKHVKKSGRKNKMVSLINSSIWTILRFYSDKNLYTSYCVKSESFCTGFQRDFFNTRLHLNSMVTFENS